jgi:GTPase SAR1 family protein
VFTIIGDKVFFAFFAFVRSSSAVAKLLGKENVAIEEMRRNPLSEVPHIRGSSNKKPDYPFKVKAPLLSSMSCLIVGAPSSGKTSLVQSWLLSRPTKKDPKAPKYYYGFFDSIDIISGSSETLELEAFGLPDEQIHDEYSEEILKSIIDRLKKSENGNSLIWLDDVVSDMSRKDRTLSKAILNRRHITENGDSDTRAELSVWISTQKYNKFPLAMRSSITTFILFQTSNGSELKNIRDELLGDLSRDQQDALFDLCWKEDHGFIYINTLAPRGKKVHCKFDLVEF